MWLAGRLHPYPMHSPHLVAITTWSRGMPLIASPAHLGRIETGRIEPGGQPARSVACCSQLPDAPPRVCTAPTQQLLVVALRLSSVVQLRCVKQGDPRCQGLLDCSQALLLGHGVGAAWGTGPEGFSMRLMWSTIRRRLAPALLPLPVPARLHGRHRTAVHHHRRKSGTNASFGALPVLLTRRKPSFLSGGTRTRGRELADPGSSSTASRTALDQHRPPRRAELPRLPPEAAVSSLTHQAQAHAGHLQPSNLALG